MNYNEKKEFLEYCKETARELEPKTNEFIEIEIGEVYDNEEYYPVTIMLNHEEGWFGSFDGAWNEQVIFSNIGKFTPVEEDYLVLNELINKVYNNLGGR